MSIEVNDGYHRLRIKELELTADYLEMLAREKEKEKEKEEKRRRRSARRMSGSARSANSSRRSSVRRLG